MSRVVLDSSAVLALLNSEPGSEQIWPLVGEAVMSAVNAAEVQGKLVKIGVEPTAAWEAVHDSVQDIVAFDSEQARIAGNLLPQTSSLGLSLGDRACLALATALRVPVYTTDPMWKKLRAGVEINLIR